MAADVVSNPCCTKLKERYLKVKGEKDNLKHYFKEVKVKFEDLLEENSRFKKAFGKIEEEKAKESSVRQQLEKEIQDLKAEISSYQKTECVENANDDEKRLLNGSISECQDEIKSLKELLQKEKKKSDSDAKKAESMKKRAAEAWKLVKVEKSKAEEQKKLAEIERKKAEEYRLCLEKSKAEVKETREKLHTELSKADESRKRIEGEKQKTVLAEARADSQTMRVVEMERLVEVEKQRALNKNSHAARLSKLLEDEKSRSQELQKKIDEILATSQGMRCSNNDEESHSGDPSIASAKTKLLKEQLKLEKKQTKYAKRMAKLEKIEKNYVIQELHSLKHSFMQILSRFNMIDDRLSRSVVGSDAVAKIGKSSEIHSFKLKTNLLGSKRGEHYPQIDCGLAEPCSMGSFNFTEPRSDYIGLPFPRSSCTRPTTGITSELESPIGGSDRNKSQSSAIYSNTSYSDKRSMGSQERGSITVTAPAKLTKKHLNKRPTVMKPSSDVAKTRENSELDIIAKNADKTCNRREVGNARLPATMHDKEEVAYGEFERNFKRRKVQDAMEPVTRVHTENNQSHFKIDGKSSAFKDLGNIEGGVTALNCSQGCEISNNLHNGIVCSGKGHKESCKQICILNSSTMANKQQTSISTLLGQNDNQKQCGKFSSQRCRDPSFVETTPSWDQLRGNTCIDQEGILNREQIDLNSFENMIRGNCLKVLDLDNDADEERYRMAVEMPLSPTLPEFKPPDHQLCVETEAQCVMERVKPVPSHSVDIMVTEIKGSNAAWILPPHEGKDSHYLTTDPERTCVIELQHSASQHDNLDGVEHNQLFFNKHSSEHAYRPGKPGDNMIDTVMVSHNAFANLNTCRYSGSDVIEKPHLVGDMTGSCILLDDGCLQSSIGKVDNYKITAYAVATRENQPCQQADLTRSGLVDNQIEGKVDVPNDKIFRSSEKQTLGSETRKFTKIDASKQAALFTDCNIEDSSSANSFAEVERNASHLVLSNIKDKDSISRILRLRNVFSCRSFIVSQLDHVVVEVHTALAINTVLLPEEKASLFFSLLLCNISSRMSANFGSFMGEHHLTCIQPFAAEISNVLSNAETKLLFEEICPLNALAGLIEDFLIERKVFMCTDIVCERENSSSEPFQTDGACEFSRTARIDQFVTGCVILASISAATNRIGFLLEASYKILLKCRNDSSWILLALHIFASVCGSDFFNVDEYGFLIIALKSVVLLLERGHQSVSAISPCCNTVCASEPSFPPCNECPFAVGAVCMDKLINLLLDVLHCYIRNVIGCSDVNNSVECSVCMIPPHAHRNEEGLDSKRKNDGQTTACLASCCLFMFRKDAADLPDCFPERAFCHFNDIISLVELISGYMSWEWTSNKIIPRLLDMLKTCKNENYSASLFVLIGELGRFGIDVGGHQNTGIAGLRCSLSVYVDTSLASKTSLLTQLAAIGALLNLLPSSFRDIVGECKVSQSADAKLVKKWFSDLSQAQQSLVLNIFGQEKFDKNDELIHER